MLRLSLVSDIFDSFVPDEFIDRVFCTMVGAPQHTFQVLTKRPDRMQRFIRDHAWAPAPNIWLGVSVENVDYAWRAETLRETPAAVRFLSCEPLLGHLPAIVLRDMDWIICGGESGAHWRPMHLDWARDIRDDCSAMGIPFFFKQVAARTPLEEAIPHDLRIRQFPRAA